MHSTIFFTKFTTALCCWRKVVPICIFGHQTWYANIPIISISVKSHILMNQGSNKFQLRGSLFRVKMAEKTKSSHLEDPYKIYQLSPIPLFTSDARPYIVQVSIQLVYSSHVLVIISYKVGLTNINASFFGSTVSFALSIWLMAQKIRCHSNHFVVNPPYSTYVPSTTNVHESSFFFLHLLHCWWR